MIQLFIFVVAFALVACIAEVVLPYLIKMGKYIINFLKNVLCLK